MSIPILATKLYIPPPRPSVVHRPRLIDRLTEGLHRKLTLISAPAGFGKTTLVSEWVDNFRFTISDLRGGGKATIDATNESQIVKRVAWLSLDEGDSDLVRFLAYLVAALQTIQGDIGTGVLGALQSSQPPPATTILTALINEIAAVADDFVLVLDDYHLTDAATPGQPRLGAIDDALAFLIEHLPPTMHLIMTTREDPNLPLARLRARSQLTEVRAADLRFTPTEAADFLNQVMDLDLSAEQVAALESRTEGWIAGLQLAALSMQRHQDAGHDDIASFIKSFTGSHRFVMDYLVEEVLHQQPASVQTFLLRTSILDRLCGPLCDALLEDGAEVQGVRDVIPASPFHPFTPAPVGQATLEALERANLFIVPLDNERRWYRYHHLFAELLQQRLSIVRADEDDDVAALHIRASVWYEANGLEIDAFHHATAANDVGRAERLIEGKGMPLHFRGAVGPVLNWLASLPTTVLDAFPSLWTAYASTLLVSGQASAVEEKLQAAEAALQGPGSEDELDDKSRDLLGRVAAIRATVAAGQQQVATIISQSRRALTYLHPENLAFRTSTNWKLGYAYHLQGERAAARQAYGEVIAAGQASGNVIFTIMATIGLGGLQKAENQLHAAAASFQRALQLFADQPLPVASEAHLGLAQIYYEWNDLAAAQRHAQQSIQLAQQGENNDNSVAGELLLARLQLAQGDVDAAADSVAQAGQSARRRNFMQRLPDVAATEVLVLLRQGNVAAAARIVQERDLPISRARVHLAQGDSAAALALLRPLRQQMAAKGWADEQIKVMVLQVIAHHMHGEADQAAQLLGDALALGEPEGFIRTFVDEGPPLAAILGGVADRGIMPGYVGKLLAALGADDDRRTEETHTAHPQTLPPVADPLVEPLSQRELEILQLIAAGQKNQEIADELIISLNTVRYHTKNLYSKLGVNKRTQAVATAQELGLI